MHRPAPAAAAPSASETLLAALLSTLDPALVLDVATARIREEARAKAEVEAQMRVYRLTPNLTADDCALGYDPRLQRRLGIGLTTARALVADGKIAVLPTGGAKGYRFTELAVRAFEATAVPPLPRF